MLVGESKPSYDSEITINVEKNDSGPKLKPFIKLCFTYKQPEKAKEMEVLFKETFNMILKLIGEEEEDWAPEMKNFHLNSMVAGNTVTFFLTTVNEELVSLIQLVSESFELCFDSTSNGKSHIKYEFDYDFDTFLTNTSSNLYDIFVRSCKFSMNSRAQHFLKAFRRVFMIENTAMGGDMIESAIGAILLHIDSVDADLEFDSFADEYNYETESREDLEEGIKELAEGFKELESKGVNIRGMLELCDADVTADASVGEWKVQSKFRLKNINKLFLKAFSDFNGSEDGDKPYMSEVPPPQLPPQVQLIEMEKVSVGSENGSLNSCGSVDSLGKPIKKQSSVIMKKGSTLKKVKVKKM